eukprot:gene12246-12383_t
MASEDESGSSGSRQRHKSSRRNCHSDQDTASGEQSEGRSTPGSGSEDQADLKPGNLTNGRAGKLPRRPAKPAASDSQDPSADSDSPSDTGGSSPAPRDKNRIKPSSKVEVLEAKQAVLRQLVETDEAFVPPPDYKVTSNLELFRQLACVYCQVMYRQVMHRQVMHRQVMHRQVMHRQVMHRQVMHCQVMYCLGPYRLLSGPLLPHLARCRQVIQGPQHSPRPSARVQQALECSIRVQDLQYPLGFICLDLTHPLHIRLSARVLQVLHHWARV